MHVDGRWLSSTIVAQQCQNLTFKHRHVQAFHSHLQTATLSTAVCFWREQSKLHPLHPMLEMTLPITCYALYLTPSSCCTSWYFCHLFPVWWLSESVAITCRALPSFLRVSEILVQGQSFARRIRKLQTSAAGPSRVEVKDRGNRGNNGNMESTGSSEQKRKKQILSYRKGGNWGNSSRDFCLWNFFCSCTFRWWSL